MLKLFTKSQHECKEPEQSTFVFMYSLHDQSVSVLGYRLAIPGPRFFNHDVWPTLIQAYAFFPVNSTQS
jgi:hypothetical protein